MPQTQFRCPSALAAGHSSRSTALCQGKIKIAVFNLTVLEISVDIKITCFFFLQVNFEEFKEGFVAVLSRSLDFSTSEEESSYLEPGI